LPEKRTRPKLTFRASRQFEKNEKKHKRSETKRKKAKRKSPLPSQPPVAVALELAALVRPVDVH